MPQKFSYALLGTLLATGAPVGLLTLRLHRRRLGWSAHEMRAELSSDAPTYLYVTIGTSIAFTLFGLLMGRQVDHLEDISVHDPLTRLRNRRGLHRRLEEELARAKRYRAPLALLLLDVDGLKHINDRLGHAAGDDALSHVAMAIRSQLRSADVGGRWGGDEFAIVAPSTSLPAALALGDRIRRVIAAARQQDRVTASIGVAVFEPDRDPATLGPLELMGRADQALYAAKLNGRNRLRPAAPPPVPTR